MIELVRITCPVCGGSGKKRVGISPQTTTTAGEPCPACYGSGIQTVSDNIYFGGDKK